jgi:hypothetical protein
MFKNINYLPTHILAFALIALNYFLQSIHNFLAPKDVKYAVIQNSLDGVSKMLTNARAWHALVKLLS